MGIEPTRLAWKARALPLSYTRKYWSGRRDSNPRPSPWQGDALPLSYFRIYLLICDPYGIRCAKLGSFAALVERCTPCG